MSTILSSLVKRLFCLRRLVKHFQFLCLMWVTIQLIFYPKRGSKLQVCDRELLIFWKKMYVHSTTEEGITVINEN